jgi:hypothetical protein
LVGWPSVWCVVSSAVVSVGGPVGGLDGGLIAKLDEEEIFVADITSNIERRALERATPEETEGEDFSFRSGEDGQAQVALFYTVSSVGDRKRCGLELG